MVQTKLTNIPTEMGKDASTHRVVNTKFQVLHGKDSIPLSERVRRLNTWQ